MNFANVKEWTIPEGDVVKVTDTNNTRVIWEKNGLYEPFYVENTTNSAKTLTISQKHQGSSAPANNITIEYSTNKISWTTLGVTSSDLTYSVPANSKLYLRSQSNALCLFDSSYRTYHTITGIPKVGGNILSLMYGSNFAGQNTFPTNVAYCLGYLFMNNTTLTNASNLLLPCDILNEGCYVAMFYGCTALSNAPKLPATTLAAHCYNSMFKQCSSLITSPDLLATNLVDSCYYQMFSACTNLRNVKCLGYNPDTTAYYTQLWLLDVYSTGTFIKASNAVWPRDDSGIPSGWTVIEV